jgi:F-type H+-transporting ATPase subunit epsilon
MKLEIIAIDKSIFTGSITQITVPGSGGSFQILLDHAPMISTLTSGKIVYMQEDAIAHELDIQQGFISIKDNQIVILYCA